MKTKSKTVKAPQGFLPQVTLAMAEKVLRDIARRSGESIRKRRSAFLKKSIGDGYAVIDPQRNVLLSGGSTSDGCDLSLAELAEWYRENDKNTQWQRTVIESIVGGKIDTGA